MPHVHNAPPRQPFHAGRSNVHPPSPATKEQMAQILTRWNELTTVTPTHVASGRQHRSMKRFLFVFKNWQVVVRSIKARLVRHPYRPITASRATTVIENGQVTVMNSDRLISVCRCRVGQRTLSDIMADCQAVNARSWLPQNRCRVLSSQSHTNHFSSLLWNAQGY